MDFGVGFYLTPREDQAKEWAVRRGKTGSLNTYRLSLTGLSMVNLDLDAVTPLQWMAVLLQFRDINIDDEDKKWLVERYAIDIDKYDVVYGYTADDQYYKIFHDFVTDRLSYRGLCQAVALGDLGRQYVIKSLKAYENLLFIKSEPVDHITWFSRGQERKKMANRKYAAIKKQYRANQKDEFYFSQIVHDKIDVHQASAIW